MNLEKDPKNDLWAFREGRKNVAGAALRADLLSIANAFRARPDDTRLAISALMRAGEFETGVADANSAAWGIAQELTDALAGAFVADPSANEILPSLLDRTTRFELPRQLSISPPEGFAYYALHPHDFARLAQKVKKNSDAALVIGIRSIGTTLSAVVRAALRREGRTTQRITVRPTGHPYDRVVHFGPAELQNILDCNSRGADFVVVDEGPGRSGSSFLSVAEALVQTGVPPSRITLLGSRPVHVDQLCAHNARERWSQFTFFWPEPSVYTRFSDHLYVGGGNWREVLWNRKTDHPACWPQMERLKFLSPDRQCIFKFEGFGRFGEEVLARANILAQAGFGCPAQDASDGMIQYPLIGGSATTTGDVSTQLLRRLAHYCAFRAAEFSVADSPPTQLPSMLRFNAQQEFGVDIGTEAEELHTAETILADGRMQPHEWIRAADGALLKVDAYTHGDDHFFPGPTDVAWDLAGTIVEWDLDKDAADFFLSEFWRKTGSNPRNVPMFVLAYTVFRLAYFKMARATVQGSPEESRIDAAYLRYRNCAEQQLRAAGILRSTIVAPTRPAVSLDCSVRSETAV